MKSYQLQTLCTQHLRVYHASTPSPNSAALKPACRLRKGVGHKDLQNSNELTPYYPHTQNECLAVFDCSFSQNRRLQAVARS